MPRTAVQLRADAEQIWRAGVSAVMPERLIGSQIRVDGNFLLVDDEAFDLGDIERIAIVGAGKAAGAMAAALERTMGPQLLAEKNVSGWLNVPADCIVPTQRVVLHAGRPAGINEPRPEGIAGTQQILEIVSKLTSNDLCICLLTGGGSALLPAPISGITLQDKIQLTRLLSAAGADIEQLNTVRSQLSLIKGGGLARACTAGQLITLVISDVLGDPLQTIASGPTVADNQSTPADALRVLEELRVIDEPTIATAVSRLRARSTERVSANKARLVAKSNASHFILGNNATAVDAAGIEAERLGYSHAMISASNPEASAESVGQHLAEIALRMRSEPGPDCLISGGEPTVTLVAESLRGKGGRNQQLALAALTTLRESEGIALLAAGTDGEDGPTDAAGAFVTEEVARSARAKGLHASEYLKHNDAYNFFHQANGLFITGPTHTNVCDLRIVVVDRQELRR